MSRKKYTMLLIGITVIGIVLIASGTYAYMTAKTNESNARANTGELDVIYNINNDASGTLIPSASKEGGLKSVATAKIGANSVPAAFNIYITPTALDGLNNTALKWEVYGYVSGNSSLVYSNSGDFSTASVGNAIKIVNEYALTTSDTTFNIFIWLDGNMITDTMINKKFTAKISADSVPITGIID